MRLGAGRHVCGCPLVAIVFVGLAAAVLLHGCLLVRGVVEGSKIAHSDLAVRDVGAGRIPLGRAGGRATGRAARRSGSRESWRESCQEIWLTGELAG